MSRPRSAKVGEVHQVKLFLTDALKGAAVAHAGGPMKLTGWTIDLLLKFVLDPSLQTTPDPGTGPASLSLELPAGLVYAMRRNGQISATIRKAFHLATRSA